MSDLGCLSLSPAILSAWYQSHPQSNEVMKPIHQRALRLMMINPQGGSWGLQPQGGTWRTVRRQLGDQDIRRHLEGDHWIGCRLPESGLTDRIILDLDCKVATAESVAARDRLCHKILRLFGPDRPPLVWATPSGRGIRVAWWIPEIPSVDLRQGDDTGLIADVLRGAGIDVGLRGEVEVFPAPNRLDRQPLGRSMSILDPESLERVVMVEGGRPYTDDELTRAVEWMERRSAQVYPDLVSHLRSLPAEAKDAAASCRRPPKRDQPQRKSPQPRIRAEKVASGRGKGASGGPLVIALHGLQRDGTRYYWEFRIGARIWAWPTAFGLRSDPSRDDVAWRLVQWLADYNNGHSAEWAASLHAGRASAMQTWKQRYLRRGPDGRAPVDRMRDAAGTLRAMAPGSPHLSRGEYRAVHRVATRSAGSLRGAIDRYRFEVWASGAIRIAKRQILRGGLSGDTETMTAQLKAEWLEGLPYGSSLQRYRRLLEEHDLLTTIAGHVWAPDAAAGSVATIYQLGELGSGSGQRWVGVDHQAIRPGVLAKRLAGETVYGRQVTDIEAYHALDACARGRSLSRIYGRGAASTIERIHRAATRRSVLL